MRMYVAILICLLVAGGGVQAGLIQHLDAARPNSIVLEPLQTDPNSFKVGTWRDQTTNANDAISANGNVLYASTTPLAGGYPGLDFGTAYNTLQLFANPGTEALLNFKAGGAAAGNTGFCVLFSMRCDGLVNSSGEANNDILGVTSAIGEGGFGIRYDNLGTLSSYIGGTGYARGTTNRMVIGDTVVVGFNYDKATGALNFWDSKNNSSLTNTKAAADFTEKGNIVKLGGTNNAGRFLKGLIGEVKVYNNVLSSADYAYQQQQLVRKWVESRAIYPINGKEVMKKDSLELKWKNLLPENEGDPVYVNVWFWTDPNKLSPVYTKVVDGVQDAVSVMVSASTAGTYYWQVDTHFGSPISEPNIIEGPVWSFIAVDDSAPTAVNAGPDMITWANEPVALNAIVTDEGASPVSYTWTASDPNAIFSPNNKVQNPTVSTDWGAGQVTVTVVAEDAANPGEVVQDSAMLTVYASACQAARIGNNQAGNWPEDLVADCVINLEDFAEIAAIWLTDYSAPAPFEKP